jgi:sortase A
MSGRQASNSFATRLLIVAGGLLLLAGLISWLPSVGATSTAGEEAPPVDFGEDTLPLRPTVTPPPFASQLTPEPAPAQLPGGFTPFYLPARRPTPTAPTAHTPTRIVISAINLDAPVEAAGWHTVNGVSQWDVPDTFAAGWLMTSAPLGQTGNTAITGHHNIAGEVFRNLVKLKPGDRITLYARDQPFRYEVKSRRILLERGQSDTVRLANARWIQPTTDERITLITCWPYASNSHRLIIVAKPVPPEKSNKPIDQ